MAQRRSAAFKGQSRQDEPRSSSGLRRLQTYHLPPKKTSETFAPNFGRTRCEDLELGRRVINKSVRFAGPQRYSWRGLTCRSLSSRESYYVGLLHYLAGRQETAQYFFDAGVRSPDLAGWPSYGELWGVLAHSWKKCPN